MNNLHLDSKTLEIHVTRSRFVIDVEIYVGKDVFDVSAKTWDSIYLPLTLDKVLVVREGVVTGMNPPHEQEGNEMVLLQTIRIVGKSLDMKDMDYYNLFRKNGVI